jgi:dephospho-CoA kinase
MTPAAVLVTGMSGTGKSTLLAELERRGHRTVDTDVGDWIDRTGPEPLWHEERIAALLAEPRVTPLFVAGTVANQGAFYDRFDAVVLLSAPEDVILERIATRTTNPFGKDEADRDRIISDLRQFEPVLRRGAGHEIDTRVTVADAADRLESIAVRAPG